MREAIEIEHITKRWGEKEALCDVSLSVGEGELFGLLGVNGAGKTTLIKILCGLTPATSGTARVLGHPVDAEREAVKALIDVSPQETAVAPNLTVEENLRFFGEIYGKRDPALREQIIAAFGLGEVRCQRARTLSGGWMRRLSVAIALMSEPRVFFLDEPTLGLDVLARRELWKIIRDLRGKITVVLTSHYLEEIEALCDRVAILARGKVLTVGTVEEIKQATGQSTFEDAFVATVEGETP